MESTATRPNRCRDAGDEFGFLRGLLGYCQMINAGAVQPSIRVEAQKYQVRFAALLLDKQKTVKRR
jgi:hypothetical protein